MFALWIDWLYSECTLPANTSGYLHLQLRLAYALPLWEGFKAGCCQGCTIIDWVTNFIKCSPHSAQYLANRSWAKTVVRIREVMHTMNNENTVTTERIVNHCRSWQSGTKLTPLVRRTRRNRGSQWRGTSSLIAGVKRIYRKKIQEAERKHYNISSAFIFLDNAGASSMVQASYLLKCGLADSITG